MDVKSLFTSLSTEEQDKLRSLLSSPKALKTTSKKAVEHTKAEDEGFYKEDPFAKAFPKGEKSRTPQPITIDLDFADSYYCPKCRTILSIDSAYSHAKVTHEHNIYVCIWPKTVTVQTFRSGSSGVSPLTSLTAIMEYIKDGAGAADSSRTEEAEQ